MPSTYLLVFLFLCKAVPFSEGRSSAYQKKKCILVIMIHIFLTNWGFTILTHKSVPWEREECDNGKMSQR